MNEKTTMNKRIKLVDKTKFINSLLENKIHERQCMIVITIALFSLVMRYNDFIKRARVVRIKRKNDCFRFKKNLQHSRE